MEKNRPWTGRAVGETDGLHFAQRINPRTLRREDGAFDHLFLGLEGAATGPCRGAEERQE